MNSVATFTRSGRKHSVFLGLGVLCCLAPVPVLAAPSDRPLFLFPPVPPAVVIGVDNIYKMLWEVVMPDVPDGYPLGSFTGEAFEPGNYLFPDGRRIGFNQYNIPPMQEYAIARSPEFNKLYFNPEVIYKPWPIVGSEETFPNANPKSAKWDPVNSCKDSAEEANKEYCRDTFDLTDEGTTDLQPPPSPVASECEGTSPSGTGKCVPLGCSTTATSCLEEPKDPKCAFAFYFNNADDGDNTWKKSKIPGNTWYSRGNCNDYKISNQGKNLQGKRKTGESGTSLSGVGIIAMQYYPATFYLKKDTEISASFGYKDDKRVEIRAREAIPKSANDDRETIKMYKYEIRKENFESTEKYQEALQNFANWFQYYRNRTLATRAALGASMRDLSNRNIRVAVFPTNDIRIGVGGGTEEGTLSDDLTLVKSTDTEDLKNMVNSKVYGMTVPPFSVGGTSALLAVRAMGDQFMNNHSLMAEDQVCQRNAGILFTAGVPSPSTLDDPAIGNEDMKNYIADDDGNIRFSGQPPFSDKNTRTTADIAMYYYANNLRSDLTTEIHDPVRIKQACHNAPWKLSPLDCQNDPHMNFYAVTLALHGNKYNNPSKTMDEIYSDPIDWDTIEKNGIEPLDDLWHATINSRGKMVDASTPDKIADELKNILTTIQEQLGSASSVTSNTTGLNTDTLIFQASFDSTHWTGHLNAYALDTVDGSKKELKWDAADGRNPLGKQSAEDRIVLSYVPCKSEAVSFLWDQLCSSQQDTLKDPDGTNGQERVAYVRGDTTNQRTGDNDTSHKFRYREGLFGDIVNSDPAFVGGQDFAYDRLPGAEGESYGDFFRDNQSRSVMLYVGANDGMLHGFDASPQKDKGGMEKLAYVPLATYKNLKDYTNPSYEHKYFVDGSPRVADVYFSDNTWHTLLVGTTAAGGHGIFALDVTSPDDFKNATSNPGKVLKWDIYEDHAPESSDLHDDTVGGNPRYGFKNYLGYTFSQAAIVRTNSTGNGKWVAILGNGYDSEKGKAVLYILDAETGHIIRSILAEDGLAYATNGLSSPLAVDIDRDLDADFVYAGDLHGNLWKFDLRSTSPSDWKVAYEGSPFFVACAAEGSTCSSDDRRPITAKPAIAPSRYTDQGGKGYMLYFGSGQYFRDTDVVRTNPPKTYSFYGLWDYDVNPDPHDDSNEGITNRKSLQVQKILKETLKGGFNLRITSDTAIDYKDAGDDRIRGWYMDLVLDGKTSAEERVVNQALVLDGRVAFVTLAPDTNQCSVGGTSWLMEVDAYSGAKSDSKLPNWDIYGQGGGPDGKIDNEDLVKDDSNNDVAPTGKESNVGITKTPSVIGAGNVEYKITSGSSGNLEITRESKNVSSRDRWTWRQLR